MNHDQIRANLIAGEAWPEGTTPNEKRLRGLLARRVGITYGDDGELQSSEPWPPIDFKRDSVDEIERKIGERGMNRMAAEHRGDTRVVEYPAVLDDVRTVLRGFEEGVFVREIAHDAESGWAMKLLPYFAALGRLQAHVDHPPPPECASNGHQQPNARSVDVTSPRLFHTEANAKRLLAIRDAHSRGEHGETWHQLYWLVADNCADQYNPWAELERLAPEAREEHMRAVDAMAPGSAPVVPRHDLLPAAIKARKVLAAWIQGVQPDGKEVSGAWYALDYAITDAGVKPKMAIPPNDISRQVAELREQYAARIDETLADVVARLLREPAMDEVMKRLFRIVPPVEGEGAISPVELADRVVAAFGKVGGR